MADTCPQLKSDGSGDLLTEAILELGEEFPAFTEVLIGERGLCGPSEILE